MDTPGARDLIPKIKPPGDYAALYADQPEVQDAQRLVKELLALSDVSKKAVLGFLLGSLTRLARDPDVAERAINILRTAKNFATPQIASPDEAVEADQLLPRP